MVSHHGLPWGMRRAGHEILDKKSLILDIERSFQGPKETVMLPVQTAWVHPWELALSSCRLIGEPALAKKQSKQKNGLPKPPLGSTQFIFQRRPHGPKHTRPSFPATSRKRCTNCLPNRRCGESIRYWPNHLFPTRTRGKDSCREGREA